MDVVVAKDILIGIAAVLAAGLAIWNFFQSPSKKNEGEIVTLRSSIDLLRREAAAECKVIDDKVDGVDRRVAALEIAIKYVPDKESTHQLEVKLTQVSGQIDTLSSKLESVEHLSRRLQNMMISKDV